tara:strand:- start:197 stop:685 length:489 start_codon:yes stop_codon:yes gene_type:complete
MSDQQLNGWGRATGWGSLAFGEGTVPVSPSAPAAANATGAPTAGVNAQAIAVCPSALGTLGSVSVLVDGEANVFPSGVAVTSALGSISLVTNNNLSVSGYAITSTLGTVTVDAEANVTLGSLDALTGNVGILVAWSMIDEDQTSRFQDISESQTPNWTDVAA